MKRQEQKSFSRIFETVAKIAFWFLCIIGAGLIIALVIVVITGIGLLPIVSPSPPIQTAGDLALKSINIILIFFTIVATFLAFFGYKEVTEHQKLRRQLEEDAKKLESESKERIKESQYMSKLNLVRIFFHLRIYDKASYVLDEIKEPRTYELLLFKGMLNSAIENYRDSLHSLEEALQFDLRPKEKARVYFARGNSYMMIGDYKKATRDYDKCLELAPDYLDAYVNKAYICKRQNDLDGAIDLINQAIKINDKDPLCYFNRACYYSLKDKKDRMEEDLKKAISIDRKWIYHALVDKDLAQNKDVVKKIIDL